MINDLLKKHPTLIPGLLSLIFMLFFSSVVGLYLYQHHRSLMTTTLNNQTEEQQRVWNTVLQGHNNGMEAYFSSIFLQEPVLELLRQAQDSDDSGVAVARVNLYRQLKGPYQELHKKGIRHLYFHTTDNYVFLRLHYPHRFGDSVNDIRPSVVEANRTLQPVAGFNIGRVVSGFRNVFPVVDGERHLGSVELGQSFDVLRSSIERLYPASEFVLILKDTAIDQIFEERRSLYSASPIGTGWLVESHKDGHHDRATTLSDDASAIIPQLKTVADFSAALNSGTAASFVVPRHSRHYLITTTPIVDMQKNLTATLLSFHASDQITHIYQRLRIDIVVSLFFSALLALTLAIIINRMNKIQSQRRVIAAIAESLHSGLFVINSYGKTLFANQRASELLGYSSAELLGTSSHDLFHVHPGPVVDCPIVQVSKHGRRYHTEEIFKRKDGCEFPVDVGAVPAEITPGEISVVVVFDDISDRKKLEAQYLQAQKMESVGILAGGIAHDFNNILSAITGFSHLVLRKMPPQDPLRKHIDQIVDASQRATALTRELLLFSRKQPGDYSPIDLNSVLYQVESFLLRTLGAEIGLGVTPAQEILPIHGDAQQLQQVIINLAINARDAMPQGGTLHIASLHVELEKPLPSYRINIPSGSYARLTISDEGTGIDTKTLDNIFDPFFTTKAVGKGTGLGLAVAYGIIQQHKGFIRVESTPGKGTCFFIYLPLTDDIVCVNTRQSSDEQNLEGTETILLAEDEPHVRAVLTEILESAGYKVLNAADGAEAVRRFQEHQDQIQLLLFDIMMPHLNGKEAADRIRRQRPDLPLLYLSGYAPDSLQQRINADVDSRCLLKPVEPQELLAAIRDILNQKN